MDKSFNSLFAEINIFAIPLTRGTCETGNNGARTMLCYRQILKIIFIFLLACVQAVNATLGSSTAPEGSEGIQYHHTEFLGWVKKRRQEIKPAALIP